MGKNILITGASGGFGELTVQTLLRRGHRVIGSIREPEGKNRDVAQRLMDAGAAIVEIDVTNEQSVAGGVAAALEINGDLDVLVNNAGTGVLGLAETFTADDLQRIFDINVLGVHRVCRALLPHFRSRGDGLLLTISSLLGRITIPFYGPYNASKWAVEALSENYRTELSAFGVDVAIVEPGGFPTTFHDALLRPSDTARISDYGDMAGAPEAAFNGFQEALAANPEQDSQLVADAVADVIEQPKGQRPFRTVVDRIGMGTPIEGYNEQLAQITHGIYSNFGTDGMLKVRVD